MGYFFAFLCETIFGLSILFSKRVTGNAGALELLSWRYGLAFAVLGFMALIGRIRVRNPRNLPKRVWLVAVLNPLVYFLAETVGIARTTAAETGAFLASIPMVTLLFSGWILKKAPRKAQVVGMTVTFFGVLFTVFAVGITSSLDLPGYGMLALAVVTYALYGVMVEACEGVPEIEITFCMTAVGAVGFSLMALVQSLCRGTVFHWLTLPFADMGFLEAILYQGLGCSILAFFLSNLAIARIGMNGVAGFIGVSTIVSIVSGMLFLGEPFTFWQAVGVGMIIVGVYLASFWKKRTQ